MSEREKKLTVLYGLAGLFDYKFSAPVLDLYMSALDPLPADELNRIASEGIQKNRWKFMPKPGEFFTSGDNAILDDARDAANLCWSAIARFGRMNPDGARDAMGELAWTVVIRMGGWPSICEVLIEEKGTFIAQFRDLAQSLSRKAERGELNIKPALPLSRKNLETVDRINKLITSIGAANGRG